MSLESDGGMIMTGENRRSRRKTCPSTTLSTTNLTWIYPGANPGLRVERRLTIIALTLNSINTLWGYNAELLIAKTGGRTIPLGFKELRYALHWTNANKTFTVTHQFLVYRPRYQIYQDVTKQVSFRGRTCERPDRSVHFELPSCTWQRSVR
jgi:hypothetical protein